MSLWAVIPANRPPIPYINGASQPDRSSLHTVSQRPRLILRQAIEWRSPRNRENALTLDDIP